MKKSPRLSPVFVALSVVLSAAPQAAFSQVVVARTAAASNGSAFGAASAVNGSPLETLRPLSALTFDASLDATRSAPSAFASAPANVFLAAAVAAPKLAPEAVKKEEFRASKNAAPVSAPIARKQGWVRRVVNFLSNPKISAASLFDNNIRASGYAMGFRGGLPKLDLPRGVTLDAKPVPPESGNGRQASVRAIPAGRLSAAVGAASPEASKGFSLVPLDADPNDAASIEAALRKIIDENPQDYQVSSSELGKVHVEKVDVGGSDPTYHAVFRQWKVGAENGSSYAAAVAGAYISFVVKVIGGKAMLVPEATSSKLYPGVNVDTTPKLDASTLRNLADKRLRPDDLGGFLRFHVRKAFRQGAAFLGLASSPDPVFITREVIYGADKQWHTVNLYRSTDLNSVIMAVDVASGKAFAWDGRVPLKSKNSDAPNAPADAPSANASVVIGRGNTYPTGTDNDKVGPMPMPFMKVKDAKGNVIAITDKDGLFSLNADGSNPIQVTFTLDSIRSHVEDQNPKNKPMTIQMNVVPGQTTTAIFNPGDDPELAANVNSLLYATDHIDWFQNVVGLSRLKDATIATINTNVPDECNAFFDPSANTLNLFHKSEQCENTAQPSVIQHETGHWVLQMHSQFAVAENAALSVYQPLSGFVGDTTNENFADYGAISHGGNPDLGMGFMNATPDKPLRTGLGMDQYDPSESDPHVPAQMQFWYQSEQELVKAGLYAAQDVQRLILTTIAHNLPGDMSSSVTQVVLAFMKDGQVPQQVMEILQRIAKAHGLPWNGVSPAPFDLPSTDASFASKREQARLSAPGESNVSSAPGTAAGRNPSRHAQELLESEVKLVTLLAGSSRSEEQVRSAVTARNWPDIARTDALVEAILDGRPVDKKEAAALARRIEAAKLGEIENFDNGHYRLLFERITDKAILSGKINASDRRQVVAEALKIQTGISRRILSWNKVLTSILNNNGQEANSADGSLLGTTALGIFGLLAGIKLAMVGAVLIPVLPAMLASAHALLPGRKAPVVLGLALSLLAAVASATFLSASMTIAIGMVSGAVSAFTVRSYILKNHAKIRAFFRRFVGK